MARLLGGATAAVDGFHNLGHDALQVHRLGVIGAATHLAGNVFKIPFDTTEVQWHGDRAVPAGEAVVTGPINNIWDLVGGLGFDPRHDLLLGGHGDPDSGAKLGSRRRNDSVNHRWCESTKGFHKAVGSTAERCVVGLRVLVFFFAANETVNKAAVLGKAASFVVCLYCLPQSVSLAGEIGIKREANIGSNGGVDELLECLLVVAEPSDLFAPHHKVWIVGGQGGLWPGRFFGDSIEVFVEVSDQHNALNV